MSLFNKIRHHRKLMPYFEGCRQVIWDIGAFCALVQFIPKVHYVISGWIVLTIAIKIADVMGGE